MGFFFLRVGWLGEGVR